MVTAKVIEIRPGRYVLKNSRGEFWGPQSNGFWWRHYRNYAKVWWTRSKAEHQLALLEQAGELS